MKFSHTQYHFLRNWLVEVKLKTYYHEYMHDHIYRKNIIIKVGLILLSGLSTLGQSLNIFIDNFWFKVILAVLTAFVAMLLMTQDQFDLSKMAELHKASYNQYDTLYSLILRKLSVDRDGEPEAVFEFLSDHKIDADDNAPHVSKKTKDRINKEHKDEMEILLKMKEHDEDDGPSSGPSSEAGRERTDSEVHNRFSSIVTKMIEQKEKARDDLKEVVIQTDEDQIKEKVNEESSDSLDGSDKSLTDNEDDEGMIDLTDPDSVQKEKDRREQRLQRNVSTTIDLQDEYERRLREQREKRRKEQLSHAMKKDN